MDISERDITKTELNAIYDDFKVIEIRDGVPQREQARHQFLAEENGEVIGFASGLTNHKWFYLTDLWVREDFRRQGLGADLLRRLEDKVAALGIKHIYTWTSGFDNPLFYEKQGYRVFAVFEDFYEIAGYHQTGYRKDIQKGA